MDARTATEIFAMRRTEQFVALDDLRTAQTRRIRPTAALRRLEPVGTVVEYAA